MSKKFFGQIITSEILEHKNAVSFLESYTKEIEIFAKKIIEVLSNKKKVLICGNGGSASDAQHFSSELICKYEKDRISLPALSLSTDSSAITAISNDFGYEYLFSRQIEGLGSKGDMLIVLTSSGNSENLFHAIKAANEKSMFTFGLLGRDGGKIRNFLDYQITIEHNRTSRIQEMHSLIIHIICKLIDKSL